MNNDKKARRRHQRICEVLQEQEHMQVLELCELFHVSPATIRNDLTVLEKSSC
ncbi:MAG: DeoR family transcriptional regulator [Clostridium sp.]